MGKKQKKASKFEALKKKLEQEQEILDTDQVKKEQETVQEQIQELAAVQQKPVDVLSAIQKKKLTSKLAEYQKIITKYNIG